MAEAELSRKPSKLQQHVEGNTFSPSLKAGLLRDLPAQVFIDYGIWK
jgi:hypothetical protein